MYENITCLCYTKILKGRVIKLDKKKYRLNEQTLGKLIQFNFEVKTLAGNKKWLYLQQQSSNALSTKKSDLNTWGNILSAVRETCR